MSCRVSTTSLIAGACVVGNRGLGVLGSIIRATTATGVHGAGYLYNDLSGADDAKEIRGLIVTPPAAGTFFAYEDGSFDFSVATDGTYTFTYRLFADGADLGTSTATVLVGVPADRTASVAGTGTIIGTGAVSVTVSGGAGIDVTASVAGTGAIVGTGAVVATISDPAPFDEPVTLTEAKTAARLELADSGMDALIEGLITMAREQAEQITGRLYRDTTERVELTDWPASTDLLYVAEPRAVAVTYWDGTTWATLDPLAFEWAAQGAGTVIAPAVGTAWPALGVRAVGARVRVDLTAGPTSAAQVPESVKLYIKALVSVWINTPDAAQRGAMQTNPLFDRLLDRERLWH